MPGIKELISNKREDVELKKKAKDGLLKEKIKDNPFFKALLPKKGWFFFSDYFKKDDVYQTILSVFYEVGADDGLPKFWGVQMLPRNLDQRVTVRTYMKLNKQEDSWVDAHVTKAEDLLNISQNETAENGTRRDMRKLSRREQDLIDIADDLDRGSKYHRVSFRILLKAPSLQLLDDSVLKIKNQYKKAFNALNVEAYVGEQARELSDLYTDVERQLGKNFMFTSDELAGNYHLLTHGIEDDDGEYIGEMVGDLNNSAVIMNFDRFSSQVVMAGKNKGVTLSGYDVRKVNATGIDLLGTKVGMSALLNEHRVVHLVLNNCQVSKIGVPLPELTTVINMNQGDINMFEMFGRVEDELTIFPAQLNKLILMVQQMFTADSSKKSIIDSVLNDLLIQFYVDKKMWYYNAQENRDRLRLVGLPHDQYPRLRVFVTYLDMLYKSILQSNKYDPDQLYAVNVLRGVFRKMLTNNSDLFDTITSKHIDNVRKGQRIIYQFGDLYKRGIPVAMAQYVNALGFAVGSLNAGDVVIVHGIDVLTPEVKAYTKAQFDLLHNQGVRTVLLYNDIDMMMDERMFNKFDEADYLILGGMSAVQVNRLKKTIEKDFTESLSKLLVHNIDTRYYIRRDIDNVVFLNDVLLGVDL